ncbi:IclR family transcriptional regulator C-terminal domain-containing protein [Streptomyces sp. R28]|uniref:IclR family transcriptional regulator C-terminal domain-containing protein n=1 Tax=Streptomyces sp. R28 TaxID=3238628 RepID=A0AB39QC61_9ACTN
MAAATAPGELEAVLPVRSGMTFPWNTAAGKVLVAGAGNSGVRPGLPVLETTGSWSREAARIRDAGFAVDHGDVVDGVRCVAAPVHDRRGAVVAALCAITDEAASLRLLTDAVLRARDQLSPH